MVERPYPISDKTDSASYQQGLYFPIFKVVHEFYPKLKAPDLSSPTFEDLFTLALSLASEIDAGLPVDACLQRGLPDWLQDTKALRDMLLTAVGQGAHVTAIKLVRKANEQGDAAFPIHHLLRSAPQDRALTVATLNWDDVILRGGFDFYDGFDHRRESSRFDDRFYENHLRQHGTLLWLHGSLHFNVAWPSSSREGSLFMEWHQNPDHALQGWVQGFGSGEVPRFPVVVGPNKPDQIAVSPFLDYWYTLWRDLLESQTIAVIGYSGGDSHLNELLQRRAHCGKPVRLIWCNLYRTRDECCQQLYKVVPGKVNRYAIQQCYSVEPDGGIQKLLEGSGFEVYVHMAGIEALAATDVRKWAELL